MNRQTIQEIAKSIAAAHDRLSGIMESETGTNDEEHEAAIDLLNTLEPLYQKVMPNLDGHDNAVERFERDVLNFSLEVDSLKWLMELPPEQFGSHRAQYIKMVMQDAKRMLDICANTIGEKTDHASADPETCKHENFFVQANVNRLEDSGRFSADIRIICDQCKTPFRFLGLPCGVDLGGATVDATGEEGRFAIGTPKTVANIIDGKCPVGFTVSRGD